MVNHGANSPEQNRDANDAQFDFLEPKEPSEVIMCLILAAAYLGLARYCWVPLVLAKNWKMLLNIEGFFVSISALAILLGIRPYLNPSSLQINTKGIKYLGPYWPRRKTVNWSQVIRLYVSDEVIFVIYRPIATRKLIWVLAIASIYLAEREKIANAIMQLSPIEPTMMRGPALLTILTLGAIFLLVIVWIVELMIT